MFSRHRNLGRSSRIRSGLWLSAAIALLVVAPAVHAECPPSFEPEVIYPSGNEPQGIAAADLNGDGKLDLVTANFGVGVNNITVIYGNGNGTFGPSSTNYPAGTRPFGVDIGDLNNDGRPDLVVPNYGSNDVSVFLGNAGGTFNPAINTGGLTNPKSVTIGRFNTDIHPDIAVTNFGTNTITVMLGNGNGTFNPLGTYVVGTWPTCIKSADFNGDSNLDLAVSNILDFGVSVLLGTGFGTFAPAVNYPNGATSVAIGDVNKDGKLDLVTSNDGNVGTVTVFFGNGNGSFAAPSSYPTGIVPGSVSIGDLDGDTWPDLVTAGAVGANSVGGAWALMNNGDGTFAPPIVIPSTSTLTGSALRDLNGDGRPDLAASGWGTNSIRVMLNNATQATYITQQPTGQVAAERQNTTMTVGSVHATWFQWRRDGVNLTNSPPFTGVTTSTLSITDASPEDSGVYDVALGSCNTKLSEPVMFFVTPAPPACTASFAAPVNYAAGGNATSAATGDLNADGRPDLAVANDSAGAVSVFLGNGNGTLAAPANYAAGGGPASVSIADLNGDGKADLAVANLGSNTVGVLLGNGNGAFASPVTYPVGSLPVSLAIGDLNADGRPDLATTNQLGSNVSILLNAGGGVYAPAVNYAVGTLPNSIALGDLNGDGKLDLAVANLGSSNISILLGNGNGTFAAAVNITTGLTPSSIAIGDLNVDGRLDLALANPASQTTSILIGNGDGTLAPTVNYGTGAAGMMITIGDVNGDGKPDLATANYNNHNVSVLLNTGIGTFAPGVTFPIGTNPNFVAIGDLNGDGKPDLASANFNGQNVSVLLNNGPSIGFTPQPQSQSVTPGGNVVFTATASGTGPFTYQWRRNGQPIIGATSNTLTINSVTSAHADAYDVQVRGGCNPLAVATSKIAVLTVGTCKGDFNLDGIFNASDIQNIVNALLAGQACP